MADLAILQQVVFFEGLSDERLKVLGDYMSTHRYKKNSIVMNQGDPTDSLFVVAEGRCRLYRSDAQGRELVISLRGAGDYFGALALLDGQGRAYSVQTLEPTTIYQVPRHDFLEMLDKHPEIALNLLRSMAERMRRMAEDVSCLALMDVYGRLTHILHKESAEQDGILKTGRLTQQDLADMTGASREMIGRIMKDLKLGGYISVESKEIILHRKLPHSW